MFSKWSLAQNKKDLFIQVLIIIPRILFKDIHDTKFMKNNLIACTTKFKSVVPPVNCACDVITNRIVLNKGRAWIWAQHPYMSFMHEHPNQSGNKTAWRSSLSIFHVLCPPRYFPSVAPVTPPPRALSCDVWRCGWDLFTTQPAINQIIQSTAYLRVHTTNFSLYISKKYIVINYERMRILLRKSFTYFQYLVVSNSRLTDTWMNQSLCSV